ncbi:phage tail tube protein [Paracoccus alkenifer]|uniref:Lambda phage tail tube protein N-terminal domain-containing protein n=1 Tax=Paracoccus alkenifer TaxID=65735 RepID=A0A1H6NIF7_9RHOB|nr:phage tail tube protein [Paracoccus alkenifer]SEI10094.1 hypothetical protein SAMN04488075_2868 [Paracoccus alkenifer]
MSDAMIGYDTRFEIETAPGAGIYVELEEVYEITPPASTISKVDVTSFKSPGRRREFIPGLTENGAASLNMNFVPGSPSDLRIEALRASGEVLSMRITYPNGVTVTFDGFVEEYTPAVPVDDRMTAAVSLSVTGEILIANPVAPTNDVPPHISGVAQVGQVLSVWPGLWSALGDITYQWRVDGSPVSGATGPTFTPLVSHIGEPVTVAVTSTNSQGSDTAISGPTANVVAA